MNTYDHVYNASNDGCEIKLQLANGYISQTTVLFESANICARVDAVGSVEFLDCNGNAVASAEAPEETSGKKKYTELLCRYDGENIILRFPIVKWIDNYPHCDGEHDRWDSVIIGYHTVTFSTETGNIEFSPSK